MEAPVSESVPGTVATNRNDRTIRILLVAFAVLAAVTAVLLATDPDRGPIGQAGLVFYPVAAVGHLVLARYHGRSWVRPVLVATEVTLVPLQFLLSIPSNLPLLGMLLSGVIVALLRPHFAQLSPRIRKYFLWLHVGLSVSWLGLSMAMLVLSLTGQFTSDRALSHDAYRIMHLFDLVIVIPVVFLSIISGLVVSLGTKWGLVRNKWVLTKFLLSLIIPSVAGFQHHWISELSDRMAAGSTAEPGTLGLVLTLCMAAYGVILWTTTALSIWKPWGKTRWGRRATESRRAGRTPARRTPAPVPARD
ncbi:hypothetical protein [Actinoplanes sp. N902-109]|uniref:hypothetical protein n=1 Tax=Actinoplanes sp. (strain N902-109) TaxID=649831 RepID=UPI000329625A|nr:hypothetical protein [Actinoplanes sp. N902-109]AGL16609.1 hypothetical protein L083_3099 [Actinoplanes sp. N902-109]